MQMTDNLASAVELLRSGIVGSIGVGEGTGLDVLDVGAEIECLVLLNVLTGLGIGDDGGDHLGRGGDLTHNDTITGACLDLQTVGQCLANTEVDEVSSIPINTLMEVEDKKER